MKSNMSRVLATALLFSSVDAVALPTVTTVSVSSTQNPSVVGQQVSFFVDVFGTTPTGAVQFTDGTIGLGAPVTVRCISGPCVISGAILQTSALAPGTHVITATYSGDNNNTPASGTVTQVVLAAASSSIPMLSPCIATLLVLVIGVAGAMSLRRS